LKPEWWGASLVQRERKPVIRDDDDKNWLTIKSEIGHDSDPVPLNSYPYKLSL
jgi:hypothetical protein